MKAQPEPSAAPTRSRYNIDSFVENDLYLRTTRSDDGHHRWCGSFNATGEPVLTVDGDDVRAARLAWYLAGNDVAPAHRVRPTCALRTCVNPDHLGVLG